MKFEEIEEKLQQLNEFRGKYEDFESIFNNYILKEDQSEVNVNYFAQEMIKTLKKMIELIKAFRGNITKEDIKSSNYLPRKDSLLDKKDRLELIEELKGEYDGYAALFKRILEEEKSEINVKYTAGEMIKTLKKMIKQIGILKEQNVVTEEKKKSDRLQNKDNER